MHAWLSGGETLKVAENLRCSKNTVTEWFDKFRMAACFVLTGPLHPACRPGEPHFKMGGRGKVVELDECKFCKAKYGRGRRGRAQCKGWVLGAVERTLTRYRRIGHRRVPVKKGRTSSLCILRPIFHGRRNAATIHAFVQKYVRPGTHLMTDEARVYRGLRRKGYRVSQCNHSLGQYVVWGWGNRTHPIHTNTIEGTWKWAREGIPVCGIKGEDVRYRLRFAEICYKRLLKNHRKWKKDDPVKLFLKHFVAWHNAGEPDTTGQM